MSEQQTGGATPLPTTEQVRTAFAEYETERAGALREQSEADFDAWLQGERRAAAIEAMERREAECETAGYPYSARILREAAEALRADLEGGR